MFLLIQVVHLIIIIGLFLLACLLIVSGGNVVVVVIVIVVVIVDLFKSREFIVFIIATVVTSLTVFVLLQLHGERLEKIFCGKIEGMVEAPDTINGLEAVGSVRVESLGLGIIGRSIVTSEREDLLHNQTN